MNGDGRGPDDPRIVPRPGGTGADFRPGLTPGQNVFEFEPAPGVPFSLLRDRFGRSVPRRPVPPADVPTGGGGLVGPIPSTGIGLAALLRGALRTGVRRVGLSTPVSIFALIFGTATIDLAVSAADKELEDELERLDLEQAILAEGRAAARRMEIAVGRRTQALLRERPDEPIPQEPIFTPITIPADVPQRAIPPLRRGPFRFPRPQRRNRPVIPEVVPGRAIPRRPPRRVPRGPIVPAGPQIPVISPEIPGQTRRIPRVTPDDSSSPEPIPVPIPVPTVSSTVSTAAAQNAARSRQSRARARARIATAATVPSSGVSTFFSFLVSSAFATAGAAAFAGAGVGTPVGTATPTPAPPGSPPPPGGLPGAGRSSQPRQDRRCQEVRRRRRRKGKCREGFFEERPGKTRFITWRTVNCITRK